MNHCLVMNLLMFLGWSNEFFSIHLQMRLKLKSLQVSKCFPDNSASKESTCKAGDPERNVGHQGPSECLLFPYLTPSFSVANIDVFSNKEHWSGLTHFTDHDSPEWSNCVELNVGVCKGVSSLLSFFSMWPDWLKTLKNSWANLKRFPPTPKALESLISSLIW